MQLSVSNLGKKFNQEWIFRNLSFSLSTGEHAVITGFNGSGKSTLLQTLAGYIIPTEGEQAVNINNHPVKIEDLHQHIGLASPYLDLIEEFSALEMASFQTVFKPFRKGITAQSLVSQAFLEEHKDKPIRNYSSGMKQRLKLALAILSDTPLLFLDEPTSNLDKKTIEWYKQLITNNIDERLVIVCSNEQAEDYFFCSKSFRMEDYKPVQDGANSL